MKQLSLKILDHPELKNIGQLTPASRPLLIGLPAVSRAALISALMSETGRPVLVVCESETQVSALAPDIEAFLGAPPHLYPERPFTFHPVDGVSHEWEHRRIETLHALSEGSLKFILTTVGAITQLAPPPGYVSSLTIKLKVGDQLDPEALVSRLVKCGYSRCGMVEGTGQFAQRGGIIDLFSPGMSSPVRLEFFGDEIDSLSSFDILSQRRSEALKEALILPTAEILPFADDMTDGRLKRSLEELIKTAKKDQNTPPKLLETLLADYERLINGAAIPAIDRYAALIYPGFSSLLDFLPKDTVVFFDESRRLFDFGKGLALQRAQDVTAMLENGVMASPQTGLFIPFTEVYSSLSSFPVVATDLIYTSNPDFHPSGVINLQARQLSMPIFERAALLPDLEYYTKAGYSILFAAASKTRCENLRTLITEAGYDCEYSKTLWLPEPGELIITEAVLSSGFDYPELKFAVLTEGGKAVRRRAKRPASRANRIYSFNDLHPGDLVVHDTHGIGRFEGLDKITVDGIIKDFIKISYAGSDVLFIPVTQLDVMSRYIGPREDSSSKLSRLGGAEWAKSRSSAKAAAKDLARELIALYSARKNIKGFPFPPDSPWQQEFEQSFDYEETDDQLKCVREIKADMESGSPMDRLLCGDVGFGKTEVAFRAIMKCVLGGKQAAILVPTTLLARQHYMTASKRFKSYPMKIEQLSRYTPAAQARRILKGLADGSVDLVIGTHKLLQKSIKFKDLGLLVVDEEQRFGVSHKERLKEMCKSVDALTLTATPIPRTLNMALSGIRDMSLMEEAPADRTPVQTYVMEHNYDILANVIRRELSRGGQVFYLHNHIESIDQVAGRLHRLIPEANIAVAHGRMDETHMAGVMNDMLDGTAQVLVCTTIIETGIDMPNVNTLIIDHADRLGLAQLHQIRGRVGRSPRRAYAYLTYRPDRMLTEVAAKRLSAIREFAEFGAGFKIALRDLEIRGTGNLLGPEQSGHMSSVGYDMYLKLLDEAVREEKGEEVREVISCSADLTINAHIPETYIPAASERVDIYRRIAAIASGEDPGDVLDELIDRYGDPPAEAINLIEIAKLRLAAATAGVSDIIQQGNQINLTFAKPPLEAISSLYSRKEFRGRLMFNAGNHPYLGVRIPSGGSPLAAAAEIISVLGEIPAQTEDPQ